MRFLSKSSVDTKTDVNELVVKLCQGEVGALEALYDCYAGQVYAFLLRAVERELAEELVQDIFMTLWQKAAQFNPTLGSFNAWFFTLVRHRMYDALRSQVKHRNQSLLSQLENGPNANEALESDTDLEEQILRLFRDEEIRQALQSLPSEQRQIIFMTYFKGFSQRELALQLNVPVSTIKGRSRLGLQKLRQLLAE